MDEEADSDVGIWAINWPSFAAFLACETQWRCALGMAGLIWLGLDYASVDVVLKHAAGGTDQARIFADLRVMECAALDAFAEVDP